MVRTLVGLILAIAIPAGAQPKEPDAKLDAAVRTQVIDAALAALQSRYVSPEVATRIEAVIRERIKAHAYDLDRLLLAVEREPSAGCRGPQRGADPARATQIPSRSAMSSNFVLCHSTSFTFSV